jgi:hypothetical protein
MNCIVLAVAKTIDHCCELVDAAEPHVLQGETGETGETSEPWLVV